MARKYIPKVRICEWCGNIIGAERGPASKTCSPECQRERNNDKEKKRYAQVKDTPEWKATRVSYVEALKIRFATDVEFAEHRLAQRRTIYKRFRAKLESDPERLERYRAESRAWHHNMTPEQRAERRYWYGSLSADYKQLFLAELRQRRALQKLRNAHSLEGNTMTFKWDEKYTPLLGMKTDRDIAAEVGCTVPVVAYQRKKRGIPTYDDDIWNSANDPLLGSATDAEIAKQLGIPVHVVRYQRQAKGIERFGGRAEPWTDHEDKLLGTDSDDVISEKLGRTKSSIVQRRAKLGIPAAPRAKAPEKRVRSRTISGELQRKLDELEPMLLQRYRDAGLPIEKLEAWQMLEIAVNELLANERKQRARSIK